MKFGRQQSMKNGINAQKKKRQTSSLFMLVNQRLLRFHYSWYCPQA